MLGSAALAAFPAGKAMDRWGRMPVIRAGFVFCGVGAILTGLGAHFEVAAPAVVGFVLIGLGNGQVLLTRGAASDMYPPEQRARGVGLVLFARCSGPSSGRSSSRRCSARTPRTPRRWPPPWFAASAFMIAGLALSLAVRVDPRRSPSTTRRSPPRPRPTTCPSTEPPAPPAPPQPLKVILRRPGVLPALLAALTSYGVMVSVMNLTGYVVIHHGHDEGDLFPIISAHIVGMFGLVLVVGDIIDKVGKRQAMVFGLVVTALSSLGLIWVHSVAGTAVLMFLLGIGWVFSFVAATTQLATSRRRPSAAS